MALVYIDPEVQGVHPLRTILSEDEVQAMVAKLMDEDENFLSLEEIECCLDYIHDYVVTQKQNVAGTCVLQ